MKVFCISLLRKRQVLTKKSMDINGKINFSLILFILVVIEKTPVHHYGKREFDIFREYRFLILKIESFLCVLLI
jgi:hypothetical protein